MSIQHQLCEPPLGFMGSCGFENIYKLAHITGFLGFDTFYFKDSRTQELDRYPGIAFGCGLINRDFPFSDSYGPKNMVAGVTGLAPGPLSLLSQFGAQIKGRFAYCLTPRSSKRTTNIYFGDDAQISGDASRTVQVISMASNVVRYHLFLNGISVDDNRLAIDPTVFELDEKGYTKGFLIDSGSPHTSLVRAAYNPLRDAMVHYFRDKYQMQPISPSGLGFDLCYSWNSSDEIRFPSVVLHFLFKGQQQEINMVLGKNNLFEVYPEDKEFCLMILPIDDDPGLSILGAYQQTNFKILYDVNDWFLYFVPQNCLQS
ncbi:aspartic proteinase nepenthesin-1-like [Silene latifolia]|uniref:aspartic proteinase nepenthesin-1-like n=1 Tax=Silene latifolia TaxID=37657 RepID=UPI003D77F24F